MFREIRKKRNEITIEETKNLLKTVRRGVLSLIGDDGYPYAVPINYLYNEDEETIIFHGAKLGYKVEALKKSDKVCFTVVGDENIKDESWAPYVKSCVLFGRCHLIESQEEITSLVKKFALKYYPSEDLVDKEIAMAGKAVQMFVINIEHMSGKEVQER